jgi:hypothetical protein
MKQESNEVKQLAAQIVSFVAKTQNSPVSASARKVLVPMLVNGTKEKNTLVRTNSELGLIHLLHLQQGDAVFKVTILHVSLLNPCRSHTFHFRRLCRVWNQACATL